jgi:hypothetical protein
MYLLSHDIACLLKTYILEDFEDFLQDEVAISLAFQSNTTAVQARDMLKDGWLNSE